MAKDGLRYATRYQIKREAIPYKDLAKAEHIKSREDYCIDACLACEREGYGIFGRHTPYIFAEPDKKSNGKEKGECWLMNERGIVNPFLMTAILSRENLVNPVAL